PVAGGPAVNLTVNGRKDGVRYRQLRSFKDDEAERGLDLAGTVYVSMYGEWTKKAGIGAVVGGQPGVKPLLWDDAAFEGLEKAKKADVSRYPRETYKAPPDYYAAGQDLADGRKLTDQAAQQAKYAWSKGSVLVEYSGTKGKRLQAALYLPADYEPGKR